MINWDFKNWKSDILIGLFLLAVFIGLNRLDSSITIGFPDMPQATEGERTGVVGFLAPVGEELSFRFALPTFLNIFLPIWAVGIITTVGFAIFHVKVYAGAFALQNVTSNLGAFVGAMIFGGVAFVVTIWRKSPLPAIVLHMFNLYLLGRLYVMVV